MIRVLFTALFSYFCLVGCSPAVPQVSIIPRPVSLTSLGGSISIQDTIGHLRFNVDTTIASPEGYRLLVDQSGVTIDGGSERAFVGAMATLAQLTLNGRIACVQIVDHPRFEWRGLMLDVARHFFPVSYVKKVIDMMAYHKLNKLHFHLTDGIGWRLAIDGYPELTQKGAWRRIKDESAPYVNFELSHQGADSVSGGFFTRQDIEELVGYARQRNVEIIPEIEMPGHSLAALCCYPDLLCDGVSQGDVYCAGNERSFEFLQRVIDQVVDMFPSQYLHIGGDEVGYQQWEQCPKCKKISSNGADVQRYFVQRIARYVASKGRRMIGWDEVARDGLDSSAVVMSWTGWQGGLYAAGIGHDVVMCPLDYVYLDHYQGQNDSEPQGWGGDNSLKRVWSFPVIPSIMADSLTHHVLGGQGNLWTENIADTAHLEYMLLPRLSALSEALWSGVSSDSTAWDGFAQRIDRQFSRYDQFGWRYSASAAGVTARQMGLDSVELSSQLPYPIYYTTDGSQPTDRSTLYTTPIVVGGAASLRAVSCRNGKPFGHPLIMGPIGHLAAGCSVTYLTKPSEQYDGGGAHALVDNRYAFKRGDSPRWVGFQTVDMDVVVDLGSVRCVSKVGVRFFQHLSTTSVILPLSVRVLVGDSVDGPFSEVKRVDLTADAELNAFSRQVDVELATISTRYVRVVGANIAVLPDNHPRGKGSAWVFADEIVVR